MRAKVFFLILFFSFSSTLGLANEYLNNIIRSSENDGSIKSIGFGQIKTKSEVKDGESKYFVEKEYMNDVYYKKNDRNEIIWFYTSIQKNKAGKTPKKIWHVIAIPSGIQRRHKIRGYMNTSTISESVKQNIITNNDRHYLIDNKSYIDIKKEKENLRFFVNNPTPTHEPTIKKGINTIWEKLVTHRNMDPVYSEINKDMGKVYYDFTFYLYSVNANPDHINKTRGYLIPSSKLIKETGTVYGIVLNENGVCLAYKSLEVKKHIGIGLPTTEDSSHTTWDDSSGRP